MDSIKDDIQIIKENKNYTYETEEGNKNDKKKYGDNNNKKEKKHSLPKVNTGHK